MVLITSMNMFIIIMMTMKKILRNLLVIRQRKVVQKLLALAVVTIDQVVVVVATAIMEKADIQHWTEAVQHLPLNKTKLYPTEERVELVYQ